MFKFVPRQSLRFTPVHQVRWAGHSKWANIKHDKAKNDAKKSKEAYHLSHRIESAVRQGGKDSNPALELLIDKAKKLNVSKTVVEKAIKRGAGEMIIEGPALSDVVYELMGPGGVAFIVQASTDNKSRTVSQVRAALAQFSASASPCLYMFDKTGEIVFLPKPDANESFDDVLEVALDIGAEDVEEVEIDNIKTPLVYRLLCDQSDVNNIVKELGSRGYSIQNSSVRYIANSDSRVPYPEESKGFIKAIDALDEVRDVVDYYTNIEDEHLHRLDS
ncbi:putative transcriptional regulatory protein [Spathaspora sp. JA1]|nr:putative transcriptional regulatory protein [Spathaspora sp. JA1]